MLSLILPHSALDKQALRGTHRNMFHDANSNA